MSNRRIEDWRSLEGVSVEIRQQEAAVFSGTVDAVTDDGTILWVSSAAQGRKLFEKAEFFQVWASEESTRHLAVDWRQL